MLDAKYYEVLATLVQKERERRDEYRSACFTPSITDDEFDARERRHREAQQNRIDHDMIRFRQLGLADSKFLDILKPLP